ncbi:site-specific DNA-methyltransferase (adenine-specific) [Porphyromonadaceae bacterium NLAE-zl-C104]|jgi:site-specific DNA-methyltransferase (adenine-specific)|nr:site-specific DNA-methyltransferase (adenine-specific) [Porphyromonadaceae bacterium KH3R12]SFS48824.1 site-specific DNA-methyltransferase (adenine-specific) [Porphyromonadaceae bacterium NLAE-zl-C104]
MIQINYNPDVLTCLANLSNDEVFTPPSLVNDILDLLPVELWSNPNAKFLDPVSKSGVFLREMAKRLMHGLETQIPDKQERINHIFSQQLYGIAITDLTALLSRRSVYCSKTANGKYSICDTFDDEQGNIRYKRMKHTWQNGKCTYCGASQEVYDREDALETYAYNFIHTDKPEKIFNMKFDVIVGNPPYQLSDGGHGRSAKPLYHKFIQQAKKLNPKYLTMIVPDRWFAGGKGLNEFRDEMLNDKRFRKIVDYTSASDAFPGADVPGGVCYFLWDNSYNGETEIEVRNGNQIDISKRYLNEFDTFIRYSTAADIIKKVRIHSKSFMSEQVSSRKPFGLATNERPKAKGDLKLKYYGGYGSYPSNLITVGSDLIPLWKVITSKTSYDHAGQPDKEGQRRVFSTLEILKPNEICTETYIIVGSFNSEKECLNLLSYLKTKFTRFLVSQLSFSQDITKDRFAFVPIEDFSEPWTDEKLYKKYGLTEEEIAFIESMIRPMDVSQNSQVDE